MGIKSDTASEDEEVELSDTEDFILMQLESGWAEAERKLYGYSRTNTEKLYNLSGTTIRRRRKLKRRNIILGEITNRTS